MTEVGRHLLDGITVLELGTVLMVPYAGQVLGDLGAEVIKVEALGGDPNRRVGPGVHPELSGVSVNLNRNKRSIALDVAHTAGHDALLRLVASADIVLTNLRPSSLRRLRLRDADLRAAREDLIYCRSHGYSDDSPADADRPAYDDVIQAATGLAGLSIPISGSPQLLPTVLADKVCGLTIVYSVLAALHERTTTGRGQEIEVPMFETMLAFNLVEHLAGATFDPPLGAPGYARVLTPYRRPHRTADGWVVIMPYSAGDWRRIWTRLGRDDVVASLHDLSDGEVKVLAPDMYAQLSLEIATRPTEHWLALCSELDIAAAPVPGLTEVIDDAGARPDRIEHARHPVAGDYLRVRRPSRFAATDTVRYEAPLVGEDSRTLLAEAGLSHEEIERLVGEGIVAVAEGGAPGRPRSDRRDVT